MRLAAFCAAAICMAALAGDQYAPTANPSPRYGFRVIRVYPHDPLAYTEGLEFRDGFLFESTGMAGKSRLRQVDLATGRVLRETELDPQYFGEGITMFGAHIFQLTWQSHRGFIYGAADFAQTGTFDFPGEGWGLTNDGTEVFMSSGESEIRCLDPATLRETRRLFVKDGPHPIGNLNELEFVHGEIYANVWLSDKIVRISPRDGRVTGWIDLEGLFPAHERPRDPEAVLNGIAWDRAQDRLFVTGKMWPKLFEIQLRAKTANGD